MYLCIVQNFCVTAKTCVLVYDMCGLVCVFFFFFFVRGCEFVCGSNNKAAVGIASHCQISQLLGFPLFMSLLITPSADDG